MNYKTANVRKENGSSSKKYNPNGQGHNGQNKNESEMANVYEQEYEY